ncbi:hypothetical protein CC86DRAFT_440163 [Ophiobolus disseminans]|uniref:Uncharacterized protein n=1 Tax=Ophiobolus disseminans TaxID=1469910 RepID=A0A6A7A2T9_9PLEO|nr:hypothetical protein CC86DRAFT_440163 [Ophiobolus disseminans]
MCFQRVTLYTCGHDATELIPHIGAGHLCREIPELFVFADMDCGCANAFVHPSLYNYEYDGEDKQQRYLRARTMKKLNGNKAREMEDYDYFMPSAVTPRNERSRSVGYEDVMYGSSRWGGDAYGRRAVSSRRQESDRWGLGDIQEEVRRIGERRQEPDRWGSGDIQEGFSDIQEASRRIPVVSRRPERTEVYDLLDYRIYPRSNRDLLERELASNVASFDARTEVDGLYTAHRSASHLYGIPRVQDRDQLLSDLRRQRRQAQQETATVHVVEDLHSAREQLRRQRDDDAENRRLCMCEDVYFVPTPSPETSSAQTQYSATRLEDGSDLQTLLRERERILEDIAMVDDIMRELGGTPTDVREERQSLKEESEDGQRERETVCRCAECENDGDSEELARMQALDEMLESDSSASSSSFFICDLGHHHEGHLIHDQHQQPETHDHGHHFHTPPHSPTPTPTPVPDLTTIPGIDRHIDSTVAQMHAVEQYVQQRKRRIAQSEQRLENLHDALQEHDRQEDEESRNDGAHEYRRRAAKGCEDGGKGKGKGKQREKGKGKERKRE